MENLVLQFDWFLANKEDLNNGTYDDYDKENMQKIIDLGLAKEVKGDYIIPKGTKVLDYGADMSGYYFHIDNEHVKDYEIHFSYVSEFDIKGHEKDCDLDLLYPFYGEFKGQKAYTRTELTNIIEQHYIDLEKDATEYGKECLANEHETIYNLLGIEDLHTVILN